MQRCSYIHDKRIKEWRVSINRTAVIIDILSFGEAFLSMGQRFVLH